MNEKLKYKIRSTVEKLGLGQSLEIFGKDILKQTYIDNPLSLSFLDQFNNLRPVEKDNEIYYVDNDNLPLFSYYIVEQDSKNGYYYINYHRIWLFFDDIMGYNYTEIQEIMKEWLGTTYNLRELTPVFRCTIKKFFGWERPII
jgi:hypothetical protein